MKRHFLKGRLLPKFIKIFFHNAIKNCPYFIPPAGYRNSVFRYDRKKPVPIAKTTFFNPCSLKCTLLLGCIFFLAGWGRGYGQSQPHRVTGTVISARDGQPLQGATVKVKSGRAGVLTGKGGSFTLTTPTTRGTIIVTFVGYQPQEADFGPDTQMPITIKLAGEGNELEEAVVNAGYYETTKRLSTGNIARIDARTIEQQPVSNLLGALVGRVPGLDITQQSGLSSGGYTVRIRGQNSLDNGNNPLFIVDGIPFNPAPLTPTGTSGSILGTWGDSPLNILNPADILNMDVLKDADATAIYGSRGANGVILITTKDGQQGPTHIQINSYTGTGSVGRKLGLLNSTEYLQMRREAFANDGLEPTPITAPDLLVWDTTRYTDWQKELIGGMAGTTDAQLSISGGAGDTRFLLGGGFHRETTVYPGKYASRRLSGQFRLDHQAFHSRVNIGLSASLSHAFSNYPGTDLTSSVSTLPPVAPAAFDDSGKLNWANSTWANPYQYMKTGFRSNQNLADGALRLGISIFKNLSFKANIGLNQSDGDSYKATPLSSYSPTIAALVQNTSVFVNQSVRNLNIEPQLNWSHLLGSGQVSAILGGTLQQQDSHQLWHTASGYTDEGLMESMALAPTVTVNADQATQYRYLAIFGRLNYNLLGRYILNFTGRRDGSSRFAPEKRYANFGAAGIAWLFSEEPAIKSFLPFLAHGKLRASYGITGNDQIADYLFLNNYRTGGIYQGMRTLVSTGLYNPDLEWEANSKLEAALELGIFNRRLEAEISYYRNESSNQLISDGLPPNTGYTSIYRNLQARILNTGCEINLRGLLVQDHQVEWSSTLTASIPRNRLLSYPGLERSTNANKYVVGKPLTISKTYQNQGVDPMTGTYRYTDYDGDGAITTADMQFAVFRGIDFNGGIQNSLRYRSVSLDVFFQFVKQTGRKYLSTNAPGTKNNQPLQVLERWQQTGDETGLPKFTTNEMWRPGDYETGDASFMRLNNISLAFQLPQMLCSKLKFQQAQIYLRGQNLFTLSPYKGLNPETQLDTWLPPLRTLTAGINVTF